MLNRQNKCDLNSIFTAHQNNNFYTICKYSVISTEIKKKSLKTVKHKSKLKCFLLQFFLNIQFTCTNS